MFVDWPTVDSVNKEALIPLNDDGNSRKRVNFAASHSLIVYGCNIPDHPITEGPDLRICNLTQPDVQPVPRTRQRCPGQQKTGSARWTTCKKRHPAAESP